jgi:hypothetical protein
MLPFAGTVFPSIAVIIIFDVVLTVVGSNVTVKLRNVPGYRVTDPLTSDADTSLPILPIKEPVIKAGDGFTTLPIVI